MRILIVDDNPTNVIIIREILKKENYRDIITASSAFDMFDVLGIKLGADVDGNVNEPEASDIDLILLDMMMPEMDGIEACGVVQKYPHLNDIPIIMVTAVGDSKKLAEALDVGAMDYVTKPINKVELMARIRLALRLKQEKDWRKERDKRIQDELKLAGLVQNAVLSPAIEDDHFHVHALYQPSAELAGDLYAWYPLGKGRYGVILLDMMGHGISSSLFCMFIASVLKDAVTTYVQPDRVVQELNRRFNQLYLEEQLVQYYFTAIYLVVDTNEKRIDYVNAGHPPALLFEDDGTVHTLDVVTHPVGLFEQMDAKTETIYYKGDSHIAMFTDGLLEVFEGETEEQFAYLTQNLSRNHTWDETEMRRIFLDDSIPKEHEDDICLVWITLKGE
ncbi:fused response regulator/phosphatase [Paenibacillus urinalis]|uniref:Fused response regulator/phosphatase n=2 Tax=Bacillati TaxID=1783272 RepID=A0ABY7X854_9BACL|nr:fused response regulator/phosphatase [Paenibacillus urinalis]WDH98081.1 fused response regulator/phosphatase [Paenibacillus urinalis]WDI01764.1 fused response regulator/phosphatase [Paenibacillus urinalis]